MEQVKGLERGLEVLRALIDLEAGTVREIALHTGLSNQAVYRCLESLQRQGFAHRNSFREAYRATTVALALGCRVSSDIVLMDCARPVIADLTPKLGWPLLLTTVSDTRVTVLESTDHLIKRKMRRFLHGAGLPQFERSSWALYLASRPPEKARTLFRRDIRDHGHELMIRDENFYESLLSRIRANGYVIYDAFRGPETSASVSVGDFDGRFYALEVRFLAADLSRKDVEKDIIPELKKAAGAIRSAAEPAISAISALRAAIKS